MSDQVFCRSIRIERPTEEVFRWHERPGALTRLCPPWEQIELVAATGGVQNGARVTLRSRVGPFWTEWRVEHRDYVAGRQFRDVQVAGPFARWEHLHRIEPDGPGACILTDEIEYRLPGGAVGRALAGGFTRRKLETMFAWRQERTKADLELATRYGPVRPMRVLVAGASGLVGRALDALLTTQGHSVVRLVRRPVAPGETGVVTWNPAAGELDTANLGEVDAVVNLSGENVGAGRWTAARREAILRSRIDTTKTLVAAVSKFGRKPEVFVNASAVGFYGERGEDEVTEASEVGQGFLPEVCLVWETHAEGAARAGIRTAWLRFGVVLTPAGGALAKLLPVFRAGFGGRVGNGKQWMSWVSIDDGVGAIYHALVEGRCAGPINVVAPQIVTNAEFSAELGRVLHRPAVVPVPAVVLRLIFGEMADATLLASTRALPERLVETGYAFRQPKLEGALRSVLGR
jgi:uncharacterized protein (TIGR01777 family)